MDITSSHETCQRINKPKLTVDSRSTLWPKHASAEAQPELLDMPSTPDLGRKYDNPRGGKRRRCATFGKKSYTGGDTRGLKESIARQELLIMSQRDTEGSNRLKVVTLQQGSTNSAKNRVLKENIHQPESMPAQNPGLNILEWVDEICMSRRSINSKLECVSLKSFRELEMLVDLWVNYVGKLYN